MFNKKINIDSVIESIDPLNLAYNKIINSDNNIFISSSHKKRPINGELYFKNNKWTIVFTGDLIDYESVPYNKILEKIEKNQLQYFKKLDGIFAIAAYNNETSELFLITDRLSLHSLYYLIDEDGVYFSTNISTFCKINKKIKFNEKWLYEYLFFNYPVGDTSIITGVKRVPHASVLKIDLKTNKTSCISYATIFKRKKELFKGKKALNLILKEFINRIPLYYNTSCQKSCALTEGWDSRTILAFRPDDNISTYTYGIKGASDIINAHKTSDSLNLKHVIINFEDDFLDNLKEYMFETVYITGGMQGILRSTLLYVYKSLKKANLELFLSGISVDCIFRGHINTPIMISKELNSLMIGKSPKIEKFRKILKNQFHDSFLQDIEIKVNEMYSKYGPLETTDFHLGFYLYETLGKYYGGEINIANQLGTIRIPANDQKIIKLAYETVFSTLELSEHKKENVKRGDKENILQSYLISKKDPILSKLPVDDTIKPHAILKGIIYFLLYCKYKRATKFIKNLETSKPNKPPLENWDYWINELNKKFIDNLIFSKHSKLKKYIKKEYLENLKENRNIEVIGKFATLEIILRLLENNWKRFW